MINIFQELNPTRKLLNLPKLFKHYKVKNIKYRYEDDTGKEKFLTVPISYRLFVKLTIWIAYETKFDEMYISENIRGGENHWISTLIDDHKNKRIDLNDYIYENS